MNWDAVGAIGQILGSVAVLVTLGYLAAQIRQTKHQMQRSISRTRAEGVSQLFINQMNNERYLDAISKANRSLGRPNGPFVSAMIERCGLSESEATTISLNFGVQWQYHTQIIRDIDELPPGERFGFDAGCRIQYAPGTVANLWYETVKAALNPDAVRYIDTLLANSD